MVRGVLATVVHGHGLPVGEEDDTAEIWRLCRGAKMAGGAFVAGVCKAFSSVSAPYMGTERTSVSAVCVDGCAVPRRCVGH